MPRKKLDIDPEQIKRLAAVQCTADEIAAVVGCSTSLIHKRFSRVLKEGRRAGRASLRRTQWKLAQGGNAAAAIWLGKVILGQREPERVDETPVTERAADIIATVKAMQALEEGGK